MSHADGRLEGQQARRRGPNHRMRRKVPKGRPGIEVGDGEPGRLFGSDGRGSASDLSNDVTPPPVSAAQQHEGKKRVVSCAPCALHDCSNRPRR